MTSPVTYKTVKVSPEIHERIHSIAGKLNGSADDAIAWLLGAGTVRVPVSEAERARWTAAAEERGLSVPEWVKLRCEAALLLGCDPGLLFQHVHRIGKNTDIIARAVGVTPPEAPEVHPPGTTESPGGIPPR